MEKQVLTFVSKVNTEFEPHRASIEHSDTDSFNLYLISSSEELSVIQCLSEIKFSFSIHGICSQALTNDIGEGREREYVCRRATERERERERKKLTIRSTSRLRTNVSPFGRLYKTNVSLPLPI